MYRRFVINVCKEIEKDQFPKDREGGISCEKTGASSRDDPATAFLVTGEENPDPTLCYRITGPMERYSISASAMGASAVCE